MLICTTPAVFLTIHHALLSSAYTRDAFGVELSRLALEDFVSAMGFPFFFSQIFLCVFVCVAGGELRWLCMEMAHTHTQSSGCCKGLLPSRMWHTIGSWWWVIIAVWQAGRCTCTASCQQTVLYQSGKQGHSCLISSICGYEWLTDG